MAGEPILAHGATIAMGVTTLANRLDISFKPPQKEKVDVTHHDSTAREFIKGFGDGGEVSFQLFYHPAPGISPSARPTTPTPPRRSR